MTSGKISIDIDKSLTERLLIEYCLMLKHSGYDYSFPFCFYALAKHWHFDKLNYYLKLIEEKE